MNEGGTIMRPAGEAFDRQDAAPGILYNGARFHVFERTEYPPEGGILVHYRGMKFPKKGFPYPEAVMASNMLKKTFKTAMSMIGRQTVLPIALFAILPWRTKMRAMERIVKSYVELADNVFVIHYLRPERYCKAAREIWRGTAVFLNALGIAPALADGAGRAVATVFEYDDSYRYFAQDLASETSRERMRRPAAEMYRLGQLFYDRDGEWEIINSRRVGTMVRSAMRVAAWALLHPKIRRAAMKAIEAVDFERLALDPGDKYHVLMRNNYNFGGIPFKERRLAYLEMHGMEHVGDDKWKPRTPQDGLPAEIEVIEDTAPQPKP